MIVRALLDEPAAELNAASELSANDSVPPSLSCWFVVHFIPAMLFPVPLVLLPAPDPDSVDGQGLKEMGPRYGGGVGP